MTEYILTLKNPVVNSSFFKCGRPHTTSKLQQNTDLVAGSGVASRESDLSYRNVGVLQFFLVVLYPPVPGTVQPSVTSAS